MRVEVMPAVCDLLAARSTAPQSTRIGGRGEHVVVR